MPAELPRQRGRRRRPPLIDAGRAPLAAAQRRPRISSRSLFARAVPEDLVRYGADDLAVLAERAWDFLARARARRAKMRLRDGRRWPTPASASR